MPNVMSAFSDFLYSQYNSLFSHRLYFSPKPMRAETKHTADFSCCMVLPVLVLMLQYALMYFSRVNLGRCRSGTICTGSCAFQRYCKSSVVQPSAKIRF